MWKPVAIYGVALALGALALQWLEYRVWAHAHAIGLYLGLVGIAFLALGIWVGAKLFRSPARLDAPFAPNARAREALGITEREADVLRLLAAGRSNKEIAIQLGVSPNTVKTHIARLYGKLGAGRRTVAVRTARELGLVP